MNRSNPTLKPAFAGPASLLAMLSLAACASASGDVEAADGFMLRTLPTPAPYVSGGDALVQLDAPAGSSLERVTFTLNGTDVTERFRPAPDDWLGRPRGARLGLLDGLPEGDNRIEATLDGKRLAVLTLTNWPVTGPIFSGEHLSPYFCLDRLERARPDQPRTFAIGNGESIEGPTVDANCSLPTRVDHVYRTRGESPRFAPLADLSQIPPDAARVVSPRGDSIPFVVRIETGTINRAIYQTAVVVDPAAPPPSPWEPPAGWNGRLVFTFGGGCEAGFFQGTSTGGVLRADMLEKGYGVASSTLSVNAQGGCNDPLSAETALMVKERFAETYGVPLHTIGSGGSGGAMQQYLIAGAYPGILDGITPSLSFPDAVSYLIDSIECYPLRDDLNAMQIDDELKRVIGGFATWETCNRSLGNRPNRASPYDCPSEIPAAERYDATARPSGVRCSVYDGMRNVFGTRRYPDAASSGQLPFGRSPHDNVGVQYGLEALRKGLISKELFLEVNERIGGWDIDFQRRPGRTEADPDALRIAYETGRVTSGSAGLALVPIIDDRTYRDPTGDFHTSYYSFVMKSRLARDNGSAENFVLLRHPPSVPIGEQVLASMDEWLTNLARDDSADPVPVKIARARPADLQDACYAEDGSRIVEPQTFDPSRIYENNAGRCNQLYPIHAGPRMVAGGPLTNDVLKCELKPLSRSEYEVSFTDAEWERLQRIFPSGVCDWTKPGVGQVSHTRTWLSFGPSEVNRYRPPSER